MKFVAGNERFPPLVPNLVIWLCGSVPAFAMLEGSTAFVLSISLAAGLLGASLTSIDRERRRWREPLRRLSEQVHAASLDPRSIRSIDPDVPVPELFRAIQALADRAREARDEPSSDSGIVVSWNEGDSQSPMTRSGLYEAPSGVHGLDDDPARSAVWTTTDMVNRLEIAAFRWIDSSPAEQAFLGLTLKELRARSFLDLVHEDDVNRVKDRFQEALNKGEVHGLVIRLRSARGKLRAVCLEVATRYDSDHRVSHLRCHLTDVTPKLKADRELRQRTRQLVEVNNRLVDTNHQLEELKERYRDLYQNAPTMYFSLDTDGRFIECNDTLLHTIGLERRELIGQPYVSLLSEPNRILFHSRFQTFLRQGAIEVESRWVKADGSEIDVWVKGLALRSSDGQIVRSRSVAQDITGRKRLESELREKNLRLASANEELLRKNKEMDEFLHVVSHDLQEPLRTLVAFSDFLMTDYGDRLDSEGRKFVTYIVDASRRLRALIQDLTRLSRAGKTANEFRHVNIDEVLGIVQADLADRIRSCSAEVDVEPSLPSVWGDRDRITQLFTNLVSNGLKYNKSDPPRVSVSRDDTREEEGWATFVVKDNGIGIDPRYHEKIFQLFRRLHTHDEYEGTGAGLAISSKIVDAHGGSIRVQSELNQGAAFFVRLPTRPPGPLEITGSSMEATDAG